MKSPAQLADKLTRQWDNANTREQRLLDPTSWPIELSIGRPSATALKQNLEQVRHHFDAWRNVTIGQVDWEKINYRDTKGAIQVPTRWRLNKPSDWIEATGHRCIITEFQKLSDIVSKVTPLFHSLLIRQRSLIVEKTESEIVQACELALLLEQNCAEGIPLRALSIAGIDSKFFERNRRLIIQLLDTRFEGLISEIGLEEFLGALNENDHWLLVADLDGSLLPFKQMRIRDSELITTPLVANNILIVENERCLHQLPQIKNTIAILGAGLNLTWMRAAWLYKRRIAYWGDIDTWGLSMLALARQLQSSLTPLLMTETVYQQFHADKAVLEPKPAGNMPPEGLISEEYQLYLHLLENKKGRLEQEFIPPELVHETVLEWVKS